MPQTSEKWEVKVGRDRYILDKKEMEILRRAMMERQKFVWFKDLCLNLNAIDSIVLVERESNLPELPLPSAELTEEERRRWEDFKKKRDILAKKKEMK